MRETQQSMNDWATETFGPRKNRMRTATRLLEEVTELLVDISTGNYSEIDSELADVCILTYQLAHDFGVYLDNAVDRKMAINRAREWRVSDEGHGYHVED